MTLDDLPTPALVLDLAVLRRNIAMMRRAVARHAGVALRPHLKTAKCREVAAMAAPGGGPVTVSTLAEARFFAAGWPDQIYAVGITPRKLDEVAALNARGARVKVITDDVEAARAVAAHPGAVEALVEVDTGEHRGGVAPARAREVALALGPRCAGVLTHAGHSYAGRTAGEMEAIAEAERAGIVAAAGALRAAGIAPRIVSLGSSPTAIHARHLEGVTEIRAGVYMFGDLFQEQIGTHPEGEIAVSVLAAVIGRRPDARALLLDAGALALSKDRSTQAAPRDDGFGLVLDLDGARRFGHATVRRAYQEHGVAAPMPDLPVGARLRVAPNHSCLTAAAFARYHVVDGSREVIATWERINGW